MHRHLSPALLALIVTSACSGAPEVGDGDLASSEAGTNSPEGDDSSSGGEGGSSSTSEGGSSFVDTDEPPACGTPCSTAIQDSCPEGSKCSVVACGEAATSVNRQICVPVHGERQPGQSCESLGTGLDGLDDCARGSICRLHAGGNEGTCLPFCSGFDADVCEDGFSCVSGIVSPICTQSCNPNSPACPFGEHCRLQHEGDPFACRPSTTSLFAGYAESCWSSSECAPGLSCQPASVPGCPGENCCTPFCETTGGNACPDAGNGQACRPYFPPSIAPEGYETLGLCTLEGWVVSPPGNQ